MAAEYAYRYDHQHAESRPKRDVFEIAVQMTNDEYAALGDHVIDNSGTPEELIESVEALIKSELNERGIRV